MGPFLGRRLQTSRLESVKGIHLQLMSWQRQLPEDLRLESYKDKGAMQGPSLLEMQALALRWTYDKYSTYSPSQPRLRVKFSSLRSTSFV
jgi:hypothetical protein